MAVAVVGAGFSGLMFAVALARAGERVDLYEEHDRVGYPEHCTGLVSEATVQAIGRPAVRSTLGVMESFVVSGPTASLRLRASRPVVKLDRVRLEQLMLEEAESEGVHYTPGLRVRARPDGSLIPTNKRYDAIVLAEGYLGAQRHELGIGFRGSPLYGVNVEVDVGGTPDFEAKFDERLSDGFFAWKVILGSTTIVGTASRDPRTLKRKLDEAMRAFEVEGRQVKVYGGPIITGPYPDKVRAGRVVVVGDASSMNKALTGGGLFPSSSAALRAETMIREGKGVPEALEESVLHVIRELKRMYRLSRLLHGRPYVVDLVIRASLESGLADRLMGKIDYDRHQTLLEQSLRTTSFYRAAFSALVRDPVNSLRLAAAAIADMI
ncbi:MAG: NAD(P)-binding protein [Acidilobus sp.]